MEAFTQKRHTAKWPQKRSNFYQFMCNDIHLGLSTSRKKNAGGKTHRWHMGFTAKAVRSAQYHTPTRSHFKREKAEQHLAVSIAWEETEEHKVQGASIWTNWCRKGQRVTVRECPFSVGACPIVIFLRNLSLVSNTAGEKEEPEERYGREGREGRDSRKGKGP